LVEIVGVSQGVWTQGPGLNNRGVSRSERESGTCKYKQVRQQGKTWQGPSKITLPFEGAAR